MFEIAYDDKRAAGIILYDFAAAVNGEQQIARHQ